MLAAPLRRRIWPEPDIGAGQPAAYGNGGAVGTPAGGAGHGAAAVEADAAHAAGHVGFELHDMAALAKRAQHAFGKGILDFKNWPFGPDPGCFDGFLYGHAVIDEVYDGLHHAGEDAQATG